MVEALAVELLGKAFPVELSRLEHGESTHDIGLGKGKGILDGAVDMTLRGEMDDAVDVLAAHEIGDSLKIADVGFDESIVGAVFDILQVGEVTGIGQFVDIENVIVGVLVDKKLDYMCADKTGSSSDDDVHGKTNIKKIKKPLTKRINYGVKISKN